MKIHINRERGAAWLVIFIFVAVALLAAYLMWKMCQAISRIHIPKVADTEQVERTNAAVHLQEQYGPEAKVFVPAMDVWLPIDALALDWYEVVESSTNLIDWIPEQMEWPEVLDSIQTNHVKPMQFYRRLLITQ